MGIYGHDETGEIGRLGTGTGWADLMEWLLTLGGVCERFAEDGYTRQPMELASALHNLTADDPDVESSRAHLVDVLKKAKGVLIASDEDLDEMAELDDDADEDDDEEEDDDDFYGADTDGDEGE